MDYPYSREFLEKITLAPVDCEKFTHGNAEKPLKTARTRLTMATCELCFPPIFPTHETNVSLVMGSYLQIGILPPVAMRRPLYQFAKRPAITNAECAWSAASGRSFSILRHVSSPPFQFRIMRPTDLMEDVARDLKETDAAVANMLEVR
jgi:hypothetical protein